MISDALRWVYETLDIGRFSVGAFLLEFIPIALLATTLMNVLSGLFPLGGASKPVASQTQVAQPTQPLANSFLPNASYTRPPPPPSAGAGSSTRAGNRQQKQQVQSAQSAQSQIQPTTNQTPSKASVPQGSAPIISLEELKKMEILEIQETDRGGL